MVVIKMAVPAITEIIMMGRRKAGLLVALEESEFPIKSVNMSNDFLVPSHYQSYHPQHQV
jgi:hypothetical protein